MNMIELAPDREIAPDPDPQTADSQQRPEEERRRHTFPPVPREGASVKEVLDMARADIAAIQKIDDPAQRQLPAAFMALNMRDNPTYHFAVHQIAPELEPELGAAAKLELKLRRDELVSPPVPARYQDAGADRWSDNLGELESRMAQSNLKELGWRDRDDIDDIMRDLERVAANSWKAAATLWDKYRPDDPDKPIFIDGDDKDPPARSAPGPDRGESADTAPTREAAADLDLPVPHADKPGKDDGEFVMPDLLRKRYLIVANKFYFRGDESRVAFEDSGKRLTTDLDDPQVARSMVALAEAKEWDGIKVKGTDDFKREVWLAASLRGMRVEGYKATDLDHARLAELRQERVEPVRNAIEHAPRRDQEKTPSPHRPDHASSKQEGRADRDGSRLRAHQALAVDTLASILRERGESDRTVEMARAIASDKLQQQRLYVGKLLEQGNAPYDNKPGNEESPYVKLRTGSGDKVIWGVDLPRAVDDAKAHVGDDIALAFRGRKKVIVPVSERGDDGKPTGRSVDLETDRNTWEVSRLDKLRDDVKAKVQRASSQAAKVQPQVRIYDKDAPRGADPVVVPAREPARTVSPEPARGN